MTEFYQEPNATVYCGHALDLKELPPESVDMCMTSPPYFGLRSYKSEPQIWDSKDGCRHEWNDVSPRRSRKATDIKNLNSKEATNAGNLGLELPNTNFCSLCGAWRGELGLEPTIELYIKHLMQIFGEVKRILKKTGTCWVVIDDSYNAGRTGGWAGGKHGISRPEIAPQQSGVTDFSLPAKSLCLIPSRFALAMVEDDSGDIYELDRGFILWYNGNVTEDTTDAIQGQRKGKAIPQGLFKAVEGRAQRPISQANGKVARAESRKGKAIQQEALLGEQGKGDSSLYQGQCQTTQDVAVSSVDSLWGQPAEVPMLRGTQDSVSINRPHEWLWAGTQEENQKYRFDIRMAKEGEIPSRLQGFVYELQHGSRLLWFLPPSRGRNLRLRKSDIPIDLLQHFHLAQQERWLVRNDIVWNKPNPMPESVKDRFTGSWEHLFFFTKSRQYYFEQQFEAAEMWGTRDRSNMRDGTDDAKLKHHGLENDTSPLGRNMRDVWAICTEASPKHDGIRNFATYPEKLCETPILAGCPQDGVVLDPFSGSGTTLAVAKRLGRKAMGIDINPDYCKLAVKRIQEISMPMELNV